MPRDKDIANDKKHTGGETKVDRPKKPAEVLKTDKADNNRSPLHADLSEKPEKENKAVQQSEDDKDNQNDT